MSIRAKILLWFSLFGIIPTILIGAYYGYQSEKSIERKVLDMSIVGARQTVRAIDDRISSLERLLNTSVQNDVIMEALNNIPRLDVVSRSFEEEKISKHFNAVAYNNPQIKSIALIPNESPTLVYGAGIASDRMSEYVRYFKDEDFRKNEIYLKIKEKPNEYEWAILETNDDKNICIVKKFSYFLYAKPMGVLVFVVNKSVFEDYILAPPAGTKAHITTVGGFDIGSMENTEQAPVQIKSNDITVAENSKAFTINASLSNGFYYDNVIEKDYLYADVRQTRKNSFLFVIVASIIFLSLAIFASISIGNRINKLTRKFKRLETGDFTVDNVLAGHDELVTIENSYNKMLTRLAQVIDQSYVYRLEKKEAQLSALQYQINPHFLYNILEVINSMAAVRKADDIREVTQCLGRLYRYNMNASKGKPTTLDDEIRHIQNYIYLQNIQMSGRLQAFYDIDDKARGQNVIRFILQPVIENAIKHGFCDKSGQCCIELSARNENGVLIIDIMDDGRGMEIETLENLQRELLRNEENSKPKTEGIGLKNVNARLKLKYGAEYGLTIASQKGKGTTVSITLPAQQ